MRIVRQPGQQPPIRFEETMSDHLADRIADRIDGLDSLTAQTAAAAVTLMPVIGYQLAKDYVMDLPSLAALRAKSYVDRRSREGHGETDSPLRRVKDVAATLTYAAVVGSLEEQISAANPAATDETGLFYISWQDVFTLAGRGVYDVGAQLSESIGNLASTAINNLQDPHALRGVN